MTWSEMGWGLGAGFLLMVVAMIAMAALCALLMRRRWSRRMPACCGFRHAGAGAPGSRALPQADAGGPPRASGPRASAAAPHATG